MAERELNILIRVKDFFTGQFKKLGDSVRGAKVPIKELGDEGEKTAGVFSRLGSAIASRFVITLGDVVNVARRVVDAFGSVIRAAEESQTAQVRLNEALRQTGQLTPAASRNLQELASTLQKETVFSDEAIQSVQQLLIQFGHLAVDQVPQATRAVLGLASAKGIDLTSAATIVSKAVAGEASALTRLGIQIDTTKQGTELYAEIMARLIPLYGQATTEAQTFQGALARIKNQFDEQLETIGKAVVGNREFAVALSGIADALADPRLATAVANLATDIANVTTAILGLIRDVGSNADTIGRVFQVLDAVARPSLENFQEAFRALEELTGGFTATASAAEGLIAGIGAASATAAPQVDRLSDSLGRQAAAASEVSASLLGAAEKAAKTLGVVLDAANASFIREEEVGSAIQAFTVLEGLFNRGKISVDAYRVAQDNLDKVLRGGTLDSIQKVVTKLEEVAPAANAAGAAAGAAIASGIEAGAARAIAAVQTIISAFQAAEAAGARAGDRINIGGGGTRLVPRHGETIRVNGRLVTYRAGSLAPSQPSRFFDHLTTQTSITSQN